MKVSVVRAATERDGVVIRFENRSQRPLRLLRPIDGSEWGWHMPIYDLSITDSSGKAVPRGGRCKLSGLYSDMKWPDDYRIQILPGDAYETTIGLARELAVSGRYTGVRPSNHVETRYSRSTRNKVRLKSLQADFMSDPDGWFISNATLTAVSR